MSLIISNNGARHRRIPGLGLAASAHAVDRLLDELWQDFHRTPAAFVAGPVARFVPHVDVTESDREYRVTAELPGLAREDFEVVLEDGVLTLKGEKRSACSEEKSRFRRAESRSGRFRRRIRFGGPVDADHVKASYRDGVLEVVVPKPEEAQPQVRTIPVQTR